MPNVLQNGYVGYFQLAVSCFESLLGAQVKCCGWLVTRVASLCVLSAGRRGQGSGLSSGYIMDTCPASQLFV